MLPGSCVFRASYKVLYAKQLRETSLNALTDFWQATSNQTLAVASEACLGRTQKTKCEHKMMIAIFTDLLTDKLIDPNKKHFRS